LKKRGGHSTLSGTGSSFSIKTKGGPEGNPSPQEMNGRRKKVAGRSQVGRRKNWNVINPGQVVDLRGGEGDD